MIIEICSTKILKIVNEANLINEWGWFTYLNNVFLQPFLTKNQEKNRDIKNSITPSAVIV